MALVHLSGDIRRRIGGRKMVEIDAATVVELIAALEDRFPDVKASQVRKTTVAIDREVKPNADYEAIGPDSEIHFLAAIGGG